MRVLGVLDRGMRSIGGVALTGQGAAILWGSLLLFLWGMRAFVFPGAEFDDSEVLVHTQYWAWGYDGRNPPLFTWLVKSVQTVTGPTLASVVTVKFALLGGAYWLLYETARRCLDDSRLAALVALSPLAMYQLVWVTTFHLTHTAAAAFCIVLTAYALVRLGAGGRLADYLLLGLSCGLGLLSKYYFALFLGVLFAAACTDRDLRHRLANGRILLTLLIAVAIAAPHYAWLSRWVGADPTAFRDLLHQRFALIDVAQGYFSPFRGLIAAPLAAMNYLLPCLVFLVAIFYRACWTAGGGVATSARYRRIFGLTLLVLMLVIVVAVGALGIPRVKMHYMVFLILFPMYFFARVQAAGPTLRQLSLYGSVLVILAGVVAAGVAVKFVVDPQRSGKAHHNVPYRMLAAELRDAGFERGTILGGLSTYSVAGNLRPYFQDSRIVSLHDWRHKLGATPSGAPWLGTPVADRGQCLLIWAADKGDQTAVMRRGARLLFGMQPEPDQRTGSVEAAMPPGGGRQFRLAYILAPDGAGTCR